MQGRSISKGCTPGDRSFHFRGEGSKQVPQSAKRIVGLLRERGWLTAGQVGRLVQMSQTIIRRRVVAEDIPTTLIGGIHRIQAGDVIRFISQYRAKNQYVIDLAIDAAREYIQYKEDENGQEY